MAITLPDLRAAVRQELRDTGKSQFDDAALDAIINEALRKTSEDTKYLIRYGGVLHTAEEPRVTIPQGLTPLYVYFAFWQTSPLAIERKENFQFDSDVLMGGSKASIPRALFHNEERRQLFLHPRPDAAPPSTTLSGAISSATAVDINVVDATKFAIDYGRAVIDPDNADTTKIEEVEYHSRDTTGAPNKIKSCTRGIPTYTAQTHPDTTKISYAPLTICYAYVHPALVAAGDAMWFPDDFIDIIKIKAAAIGHRQVRRYAEYTLYHQLYVREIGPYMNRGNALSGYSYFENTPGAQSDLLSGLRH
jgi:hypothetical protein